jgi:hypothetical protein
MSKVFINDEIFTSDVDYVIGGFYTDKQSEFTFADFEVELRNRIERLVTEFYNNTVEIERKRGNENPELKAQQDIAYILYDNMKRSVDYFDIDAFVDVIYNDIRVQTWLDDIRTNVKEYKESSIGGGIVNNSASMSQLSMDYKTAKFFTDSSFEQFIEEVSSLEL